MTFEVTRFAPSPSGRLHRGHAFAALFAARAAGPAGTFLLRFEDIDTARCKSEYERGILDDLEWLGLTPAAKPWRQSERFAAYESALERLRDRGLLYPCFCTRKEIAAEIARAANAPHPLAKTGPDGPLYPGTCRHLTEAERADRIARGDAYAWRLDNAKARAAAGALVWDDYSHGAIAATPEIHGDAVLARKDTPASYHLSVVVDDAAQGVTLVTRGEDLRPATHLHVLLQSLLDLARPRYRHHKLILDAHGKRLAKRDDAESLAALRTNGIAAAAIIESFANDLPQNG
jgi:glutamyl-Q tRNA(Asp) synthetase